MIANRPELLHALACRNLTKVTLCLSSVAPGERNPQGSRIDVTKRSSAFSRIERDYAPWRDKEPVTM